MLSRLKRLIFVAFACSFAFVFSANAVVGYTCTRTYSSCSAGYYLSNNNTVCASCPSNCECAGGAAAPVCTYTITLNANGGTGTIKKSDGTTATITASAQTTTFTCTAGSSISFPSTWAATPSANDTNNLTKGSGTSSAVFLGWATTSGATVANAPTTCPTADTPYYAVWVVPTCTKGTGVNTTSLNSVSGNAPVCNRSSSGGYYCSATQTGTAGATSLTVTCSQATAGHYAAAGATSQSNCGNGKYSGNGAASCTSCTTTSGWSTHTTSETATAYTACFQRRTPSGCASGNTKRAASSISGTTITYGTESVENALSASGGHKVSGITCPECENGTFYGGGTATSCTACPGLTSGYSYVSGTGWTSYSSCKEQMRPTNCYGGYLTKTASSASAWGTAVSTLTAKAGYKTSGSGDSATCSECGDGYYSANGNDGTCDACPTADSGGWTVATTSTTATVYSACYEKKVGTAISSYCTAGELRRAASSASAYSSTVTIATALKAAKGAYVNSQTCSQCTGSTYQDVSGSTATSCSACPTKETNWTQGTGTGWTAVTQCFETRNATEISSYCSAGVAKKFATNSTTWGTASASTAFQAKAGSFVSGLNCTQCATGSYTASAGTQTSCTVCGSGTTTTAAGQTSCNKTCDNNNAYDHEWATTAWNNNSPTGLCKITSCKVGSYYTSTNSGNTNTCTACAAGTYLGGSDGHTTTACTAASKGYYVSGTGKTAQTACGAGTYTSSTGKSACSNVTAGYYSTGGGMSATPTANGNGNGSNGCLSGYQCGEISSGYYCSAGAKKAAPTSASDSVSSSASCGACSALTAPSVTGGTFSSASVRNANTTCRYVAPDKTKPDNCATITKNTVSFNGTAWGTNFYTVTANAGSYITANNTKSPTCGLCPTGSYTASAGAQTSCTVCGSADATKGKTTSGQGKTSCDTNCSNNNKVASWTTASWTSGAPANVCKVASCGAGSYYSSSGNGSCTNCADGSYMASTSHTTTACSLCSALTAPSVTGGTFSTGGNTGSTANTACRYVAPNKDTPSNCSGISKNTVSYSGSAWGTNFYTVTSAAGKYITANNNAEPTCAVCPAGKYTSSASQTSCSNVNAGYYSTGGGMSATPSANGNGNGSNGCLSGYQCGKISAGYYCSAGAKKAAPTSASDSVSSSASCGACSGLTGVSPTGGTYTSTAGSTANTACKYTAPNKTITGCKTVTSQQVTYSGSAWPASTYGVTASKGYVIANNNKSNATCTQCTSGGYQATDGSTATSCTQCSGLGYPTGFTSGGTFSSVSPYDANTTCRYKAPDMSATPSNCSGVTTNTVTYSGTAWNTNIYTVTSASGNYITSNDNSSPTCSACPSGWDKSAANATSNAACYKNVTMNKNGYSGSITAGGTSGTCTWTASSTTSSSTLSVWYNKECTLPTISGFTQTGYTNSSAWSSANTIAGTAITKISASTTAPASTIYVRKVSCAANYYKNNSTTCSTCASLTTNGFYGTSAAGTTTDSTVCKGTTTAGNYVATANAEETTCAKGGYCPGGVTVAYGSTGGRTTCPANSYCVAGVSAATACNTLGGKLYTKSASGSDEDTDCYITTTAGKYLAASTDTAQTTCPGKFYCPSVNLYYPNVGSTTNADTVADGVYNCPAATTSGDAPTVRTTYPDNYYEPVTRVSFSVQGSTGRTSLENCLASYTFDNARGRFVAESTPYSATSGKYDRTGGNLYYTKYNAGYYGVTKYSSNYCDTNPSSRRMYHKDAQPCPEGSYCPALTTIPLCNSGTYADTINIYACAAPYSSSAALSDDANDCYLTTTSGNYVAAAGEGEVTCACGGYCPGGSTIYKGGSVSGRSTTGGRTGCGSGKYNASTGSSASSACSTASAGYYASSSCSQTICAAGTYSAGGVASCSNVDAGYYSTGGGTSKTPTANGNGCVGSGNTCGKIDAGYYCSAGAKKKDPASASDSVSTSASCGACSGLSGVSPTGGSYTSTAGSTANTACKYTAPDKTITGCKTVTSQQVTYSGSAWPASTYGVTANKGYVIANNNKSNATCTACSGSTYQDVDGATVTSCTSCPTAETNWTQGTGTGWTAITSCFETRNATAISSYCDSGVLKKFSKSDGTWDTASASTAFKAKAGSYITGSGNSLSCTQCPIGSYTSSVGTQTSCTVCGSADGTKGKTTSAKGKTSCDANCSNNNKVKTWTTASWTSGAPANVCKVSSCSAGSSYSSSSNGSCTDCAAGTYMGTDGHTTTACTAAAKGYFAAGTGNINQTLCAAGSYTDATGQAACTACQNGTTNTGTNATSQQSCGTTCSNANNLRTDTTALWETASWTNNSVTNACTLKNTACAVTYYYNNNACVICPVADSTTARTTYPNSYYTVSSCTLSRQNWTKGITTIEGCSANYVCYNERGKFTAQSVAYSSTSGKYDRTEGAIYYNTTNAGYYMSTKYSATYCNTTTNNMLYKDAQPCPEGSYCPGVSSLVKCSTGTYNDTFGINSCSDDTSTKYPNSAAQSSKIGQCYLTTTSTKYVASQGAGEVTCACGGYCPGGTTVYYNSDGGAATGGRTGCGSGKYNASTGSSASSACSTAAAGYYANSSCSATICGAGTYSAAGAASCSNINAGYYSTGGGTSATPTANGNGCTGSGNTCGKITSGYYCSAGAKKAAPTSASDSVSTSASCGACPAAATYKRTTFPDNYYASTISSTSLSMGTGATAITQCRVLSWISGTRGTLYEYATYNTSTNKYDTSTGYGWSDVNAGYYLTTKGGCGSYAYYKDANVCPTGSYCPGKTRVACNTSNQGTVHTTTFGLETCPTAYPNSAEGTTTSDNCYLTLTAGNYVATAGAGAVTCAAGGYCASTDNIYYGGTHSASHMTTGGRTECGAGTYNANTGSTASSACTAASKGYYVSGTGKTTQTACGAGTYTSSTGKSACSNVTAGYYSTGGGMSATPTANGNGNGSNGCLSGYQCGELTTGYYCSAGAKKAAPTSASDSVSSSASCGACSALTAPSVTGGTFSSASVRNANTTCRYVAPDKTKPDNCATITKNTVSFNGTAWGTNFYTVTADAGSYISTNNNATPACTQCATGSYTASAGTQTSCTVCGSGTTTTAAGQTSCNKTCDNNNAYDHEWATTAWNNNSPTGLCKITSCKVGSYYTSTNSGNTNTCTACAAGTYLGGSDGHTTTACTSAAKGYYVSGTGKTTQTACGAGTYTSSTGKSACSNVTAGYYSTGGGMSATPTANGNGNGSNGCLSGYQCGELTTGYYCSAGAKKAAPTSASDSVSSSASCGACSALTVPTSGWVSNGTYTSESVRNANTKCRYKAPDMSSTPTNCATVTTNTLSYSGSAWPTNIYTVTSASGKYITSNDNSSPTCSACPSGYGASAANSTNIGQCYLTLTAGKQVASAGAGASNCAQNSYCTSTSKIYYNTDGGTAVYTGATCSSGTNSKYTKSAAGADKVGKCYLTLTAGQQVASAGAGASNCSAGNYCTSTGNVYYNTDGGTTTTYTGTACAIGSYSSAGSSTCTACPAGKKTASTGTAFNTDAATTCATACSSITNLKTWGTQTWNSSNNSVTGLCTVGTCVAGAYKSSNTCPVCDADTYSAAGASSCTGCLSNYHTSGTAVGNHDNKNDCKITCNGGYYLKTANDTTCTAVGVGKWAAASTVAQGSAGSVNSCATGLTTIGYGPGADEAGDCGRKFYAGENVLYLRSDKKTTPAFNVKIGDTKYYGNISTTEKNMSNGTSQKMKAKKSDGTLYWIHDDSVEIPSGYTPMSYIQSSGSSSIDTGVSGLNSGEWEIYAKWMLTGAPTSDYGYVVGAFNSGAENAYRIITNQQSTSSYYVNGNSKAGGGSIGVSAAMNAVHEGLIRNGSVIVDGTTTSTTTQGTTIPSGTTIKIFTSGFVGRMYGSYATKDGVAQYNMIPVKRNSDNKCGMYDTVSGTFFGSATAFTCQ